MKRPMIYILLFFIIGIIVGQYTPGLGCIVLFIVAIYFLAFVFYKKYYFVWILFLPLLSLSGIVFIQLSLTPKNLEIDNAAKLNLNTEIKGLVISSDETASGYCKMTIKSNQICIDNKVYNEKIKILIYSSDFAETGEQISVSGNLNCLEHAVNFGAYDEFKYLKARKVQYKMFADINDYGERKLNLSVLLSDFRKRIEDVFDNTFPKEEAGIIKAIITGNRSDLENEQKELFSDAGIYHIVAISGLHISIVAMIIMFFTNRIHRRFGSIAVILILVLYCIFTGASPSTIRAVIMTSVVLFGFLILRSSDLLTSLAFSAFLILIYEPMYLFDIGFQYSFLSVLGIALFTDKISEIFEDKIVIEGFSCGIAANIMSKPLTMFYFSKFNFIDIFVNLILIPFLSFIVLFGIFTGLVGLVSIEAARFFGGIVFIIVKFYETVCKFETSIPFFQIITGSPKLFFVLGIYVVIALFANFIYNKSEKNKMLLISATVLFSVSFIIYALIPGKLDVTMLSVGNGDCIVGKKGSDTFIIDGGGNAVKPLGNDTGVNVLLPYLKYMGINDVDAVFISHMDDDHIKGIIEIIGKIKINKIYIADLNYDNEYYNLLLDNAESNNIEIVKISSGSKIDALKDISFDCIYPTAGEDYAGNNSSLVLKMNYKNVSFLFTGDIEKETEEKILNSKNNIGVDIIKVAHHGSKTSSQDEFLDAVNPKCAIVSTKKNNSYGHPAEETVENFNERNIPLINTADNGAVKLITDGNYIKFKTALEVNKFETIKK